MVELTADRLILVDSGTAREYAGSMEDYIDFIPGRNQPKGTRDGKAKGAKGGALAGTDLRAAQSDLSKAEAAIARLSAEVEQLDSEILALSTKAGGQAGSAMQALLTKRARAADSLDEAERSWLAAGTVLEAIGQA